jgi:hypothetical protein
MSASLGRALRSATRGSGSAPVSRVSLTNAERERINSILLSMIPENVKKYGVTNRRGGAIGKRRIVKSRLSNISNEEKKRILNTHYTLSPLKPSKTARAVTFTLNKLGVSAAAPGQMLNVKQLAQIFLTEEQKPAIKRLLVQSGYSKNEGEAIANAANKILSNKAGSNRRKAATKLSHVVFDYLMLPGNATARGVNIKGGLWNFAKQKIPSLAKKHPVKTSGVALGTAYVAHAVGSKAVRNVKHVVKHHPRKTAAGIGAILTGLLVRKLLSRKKKSPSPARPKTPSPSPRRLSPVHSNSGN